MQRWTRGFSWLAALLVWLGAVLVIMAFHTLLTVAPSTEQNAAIREQSLEGTLFLMPLILGPAIIALWRRTDFSAKGVLSGIGLSGTLACILAVLGLGQLGPGVWAVIYWMYLGIAVWLIGVNVPRLRITRPLRMILAGCGVVAGVCWAIFIGTLAFNVTLASLYPGLWSVPGDLSNVPLWLVPLITALQTAMHTTSFYNALLTIMAVAFIIWAVGTGLMLAFPPRRSDSTNPLAA